MVMNIQIRTKRNTLQKWRSPDNPYEYRERDSLGTCKRTVVASDLIHFMAFLLS